ncbi:MAG: molecular chaperone DnaK [Deltaproteobacteria bacterium]|nr:molecular chaperone DnaK [Deltaproteobacteria bacterium]
MSRAIGIDLGTTNSCVAVVENGEPIVIPNDEGGNTTPSVVAFTQDGERLVGQVARRQAVTNPSRTIYAAKRFIGRKFEEPEVERTSGLVPYDIVSAENGDAWIEIDDKSYAPPNIGAIVLAKIKETAEDYLGEDVTEAVITVPAYFNDSQRQATKDAGRIAGLDVKRIINEPTAAALAYGLGKTEQERIAVFDLGGGTFDISILELDDGVFQVKSTNGDTFLGGEDFDNTLINFILSEFEQESGVNLRGDKVAMQRVKEEAEKAKHELSNSLETDISLPFISVGPDGPLHIDLSLDRDKLEELVSELIERLAIPCLQCIEDAGFQKEDLTAIILVGGMTRMPRVQERVEEIFGMPPEKGVNPDEVVAVGAAIQASILKGEVKDVLLVDVTPLTMGIEISGGAMEPIIKRNTTIPCRHSKIFTTAMDNQAMVRVKIVQGERKMAEDNKMLGILELHGLPPAPRGVPEIEVTFELDVNGILKVSAKDLATGKKQDMRIISSSGLSGDDIQDMILDAEKYKSTDQNRAELAEAKTQLDSLIYSTSRNLEEFADVLSDDVEETLQDTLDNAEDAMESSSLDEVQAAYDELFKTAQLLGEAIYKEAQEGGSTKEDDDSLGDLDDDDLLADFDLDDDTFSDLDDE